MFELLQSWFKKYFSDPEAAILLITLVLGFIFIIFFSGIFAPIIVSLAIAYILDLIIVFSCKKLKVPRIIALLLVYILFIILVVFSVLVFLPFISKQISQLLGELPNLVGQTHNFVLDLQKKYPEYISKNIAQNIVQASTFSSDKLAGISKTLVSLSVSSIPSIVSWLVYLFLVPLLVLFFLKDKSKLLAWTKIYIPKRRDLLVDVCLEMKTQLGNYLRGKIFEMIVVGIVTYCGFWLFNLNYAFLLAFLVGVSVLIPYVGMVIVTIPVVIVGLLQWGVEPYFFYMLLVFFVIQALDGNVLVPLLFSEAMNLHPVAIIAAILFFGGIWGFWGLFFAIPLATLVKAVISAWGRHSNIIKQ